VPTFCRHNRFLDRCPICSAQASVTPAAARTTRRSPAGTKRASAQRPGGPRQRQGDGLRVRREQRTERDGYSSTLIPGVLSSADAGRLADEIAFASGRLKLLALEAPGLYGELQRAAAEDLERATWGCFMTAYLSPLQGREPFSSIRTALQARPGGEDPTLAELELGPRTSHDPARGAATLVAYRQWAACTEVGHDRGAGAGVEAAAGGLGEGGSEPPPRLCQERAFTGDQAWSPERRFARIFERLALPGLGRMGRYDLLVTLGRLGLYELRAETLGLAGARTPGGDDLTAEAAKRIFAIGDPLLLERRAQALAQALEVPVEALDLALANWAAGERATLGVPAETCDEALLARAPGVLGI